MARLSTYPQLRRFVGRVAAARVVTIQAVARTLEWTTACVHRIDDVFRPTRAANGERLYDVARMRFPFETIDNASPVPAPIVISAAGYKELRQRWPAGRSS